CLRRAEDALTKEKRRRQELFSCFYDELQFKLERERPVDCVVVVTNKTLKAYAESLGCQVQGLGLSVDLIFLKTEKSLVEAMEDVRKSGTPFIITVSQQHELYKSCTVIILHGRKPTEHRNMKEYAAIELIGERYEQYVAARRESEHTEASRGATEAAEKSLAREMALRRAYEDSLIPPASIAALLYLLVDSRHLAAEEIDQVVRYLQRRKEALM
uniref:Uncharacterized protein n=1 Tax=Petromyzon marinus TaxID=7757 RepID=S4RUE1_PETMA